MNLLITPLLTCFSCVFKRYFSYNLDRLVLRSSVTSKPSLTAGSQDYPGKN